MATVKVTNLKNVTSAIKKQIVKASRDKSIRAGVGDIVVDDIQNKNYRNVSPTEPYARFRKRIKNKKDFKFDPAKINFTVKGSLMKDLRKNVVVSTTGGEIRYIIEHSDKLHTGYSVKKSPRKGSKPYKTKPIAFKKIQKELAKYSKDYDYLKFSNQVLAKLNKFIKNSLIKLLT